MALTLYITHPEVVIDPGVPMPRWGLNATGRARATAFANRRLLPVGTRIFSSSEQKALDLAEILAAPIGGKISANEAFCENDRSATGFLAGESFTEAVRQLFGAGEELPGPRAPVAQTREYNPVATGLQSKTRRVGCPVNAGPVRDVWNNRQSR